jgi:hypothetical protein
MQIAITVLMINQIIQVRINHHFNKLKWNQYLTIIIVNIIKAFIVT